ncbi:hypothetical protein DFH29DRAFT_294798 [Suillus ampliporus]|nr:hypothetical protein DFH29DRAFT_294798 [Suillus ampliporus]
MPKGTFKMRDRSPDPPSPHHCSDQNASNTSIPCTFHQTNSARRSPFWNAQTTHSSIPTPFYETANSERTLRVQIRSRGSQWNRSLIPPLTPLHSCPKLKRWKRAAHAQQQNTSKFLKPVRRALHELDLTTIELRAAQTRREHAENHRKKAAAGFLDIDAEFS